MSPRHLALSCRAAVLCALALPAAVHADDAPISIAPTASLMLDRVAVDDDTRPLEDAWDARRVRAGIIIKQEGRFQLRLEHDATDNSTPEISLQWFLPRGQSLRVGQFKQAFLLDDIINERQTPMLEPSLASAFLISRRLGVEHAISGANWTWQAAVFDQRLDGTQERRGLVARYTRVAARGDGWLLHLGGSAATEDPKGDTFRVSARPETYFGVPALVDTGSFGGVDRISRAAIESLWIAGPWSVQAEAAGLRAARDGDDFDGRAGYVLLGWSPTGHARGYAKGVVGWPAQVDGAVELFARASRIDLDDGPVRGGRQTNLSLGATWYVNKNLRFVAALIRMDSERRGVADDPAVFALRAQISI